MLQQYINSSMSKFADTQIVQGQQQPPPSHTIRNLALGVGTLAAGAVAGHHLSKIPAVSDAIKAVGAKVKPLAEGAAKVEADLGAATPIHAATATPKPSTPAPVTATPTTEVHNTKTTPKPSTTTPTPSSTAPAVATSAPTATAHNVNDFVHTPAAETQQKPVSTSVKPSTVATPTTTPTKNNTPAPVTTTNNSSNVQSMVQNSAENIPSKATNGVANNAPKNTTPTKHNTPSVVSSAQDTDLHNALGAAPNTNHTEQQKVAPTSNISKMITTSSERTNPDNYLHANLGAKIEPGSDLHEALGAKPSGSKDFEPMPDQNKQHRKSDLGKGFEPMPAQNMQPRKSDYGQEPAVVPSVTPQAPANAVANNLGSGEKKPSNISKMVQNSAENIPSKVTNGVANNAPVRNKAKEHSFF